jgi:hypothetical protein
MGLVNKVVPAANVMDEARDAFMRQEGLATCNEKRPSLVIGLVTAPVQ